MFASRKRKADGKTVTETFFSPASLAKAQREVAEYHRFRELSGQLLEVNEQICGRKSSSRHFHVTHPNPRSLAYSLGRGAILKTVFKSSLSRMGIALLALCAALPAVADIRFQVRQMTRDDVPRGKGQCDIRLQVDDQVEVTVRGDTVSVRTISGREARDDGSECNAPLPRGPIAGFNFEVKDSRNEIRLTAPPDRRNDFAAVVYIRDSDGGYGRYDFRLSWDMIATSEMRPPDRHDDDRGRNFDRRDDDRRDGFVWNNVLSFKGQGRGSAVYNDSDMRRLSGVSVDIDRGGHFQAVFRSDRGRPVVFTGMVVAREGGRLKADVASEDGRLRGPMFLVVDDRQNISNVTLEATDGRDRVRLNWDRR
jgi:hypothetical protein